MTRPAILVVALALAACGGDTPSDSTPAATATAAPASVTAAPTGTPLPGTSCRVAPVSKPADRCEREAQGDFVAQVDAAIRKLMADEPDIFDDVTIQDMPRYRVGVLRNLEAAGLCAQWDEDRNGVRELMVKNSNDYSEQYRIDVSGESARSGPGAYRATCYPANFPVNPQPLRGAALRPRAGCGPAALPPSAAVTASEILAALEPVVQTLEALGVRYYVGGSLASSVRGCRWRHEDSLGPIGRDLPTAVGRGLGSRRSVRACVEGIGGRRDVVIAVFYGGPPAASAAGRR